MSIYQEENTCTGKNHLGRRENLSNRYQCEIPKRLIDMYQVNPYAKCRRKRIQYVDSWVKPSPQSLITAPGLLEPVDLVLKYGQNSRGRVACLELAGERMDGKILFGRFLVCLESIFKNDLKIGRRRCRRGCLRHRARSGGLTHVEVVLVRWRMRGLEDAGEHAYGLCPSTVSRPYWIRMIDARRTNVTTPPPEI